MNSFRVIVVFFLESAEVRRRRRDFFIGLGAVG